jgi:dienelactone hydrolase
VTARLVRYTGDCTSLEGFLAYDEARTGRRPAVLVAHTWAGRNQFVCERAGRLADLGYAGFALDLYGNATVGSSPQENARLMQPFMDDRAMLRRRMAAALRAVMDLEVVDARRVAAVGYCFGGLCVLDLARSGAALRGVVSFHGLLQGAPGLPSGPIGAKVLALHGFDDPFAPPEALLGFCREMTAAGADWQVHAYGRCMHGFTNPQARDAERGILFDAAAERRSWAAMSAFLEEVLAPT